MIKKINFQVEIITPMFISGADQRKAELRAASIKGLMRFWWRALQAESDLKKLREKENKLFGSSNEGTGGSRFSIRVSQPDRQFLPDFKNEIKDNNGKVKAELAGAGYLLYSTFMQTNKKRPYFPSGSKFNVTFAAHDEKYLKNAAASLWALVYLGGIGTRARRGAGNVVVTGVEDRQCILNDSGLDFIPECNNIKEVANWLMDNLRSAKHILTDSRNGFIAEYSNISISRCILGSEYHSTWEGALNDAGAVFKKFRDKNKGRIYDSAAFGLPIMHRSSHTTVKGRTGGSNINRRSSPLVFKVIKIKNKYYWFVLRLAGEFLSEGGVITANRESGKPEYGIIDEVWEEFRKKGQEHILSMPQTLEDTIDRIKNEIKPQKIILFGSKARGDFHVRSDTDIAIEADGALGELSLSGSVDIVDLKHADNELKRKIKKEGVVIYERKG